MAGGWKYIAVRFPAKTAAEIKQKGIKFQSLIKVDRTDVYHLAGENSLPIFPAMSDEDQLFNLNTDMLEQHNLANDPACAAKLQEMKKLLATALAPLPHAFGEFNAAK